VCTRRNAFASAARSGFQHYRVADLRGNFFAFFRRNETARVSGNNGHAGFFHFLTGAGFRAHHFHGVRSWPDKFHARIGTRLCELRVFREEAVAGMDGLGARAFRYVENLVHPKIGLGGRSRADGYASSDLRTWSAARSTSE